MINKNKYQDILDSYGDDYIKAKNELSFDNITSRFGPVPSPLWIEELLNDFYKDGSKLLDIGCGFGNILKLSNEIGYKSTGIEINEDLSKHHKELDVIYGDVLNMDLSFIKKFDIIYTYRIIKETSICNELFNKIYNNMGDDSIIIYILPHIFNHSGRFGKDRDIHHLTEKLHVTKTEHRHRYYNILEKNKKYVKFTYK